MSPKLSPSFKFPTKILYAFLVITLNNINRQIAHIASSGQYRPFSIWKLLVSLLLCVLILCKELKKLMHYEEVKFVKENGSTIQSAQKRQGAGTLSSSVHYIFELLNRLKEKKGKVIPVTGVKAHRVVRCRGFHIFSGQSAHRWQWGRQPQEDSWYSFPLEAQSIAGS
jgi:hypothetical protein